MQDEVVTKYLIWRPHENLEVTKQFVDRCIAKWHNRSAFAWVVICKSDMELIGMFELRIQSNQADFGYVLTREVWGNGYATEAAKAVVDWAKDQAEILRIWATCDVENMASARVLEKAGLKLEGILRKYMVKPNISDEPRDSLCYSMVK